MSQLAGYGCGLEQQSDQDEDAHHEIDPEPGPG